jgi:RNA polymerase sigma-70 factor (ECF subfamily)
METPAGSSILEHISTHWHVVGDPLQFVMRYASAVRRYVGALVKNPHDSEDIVQDLLLQTLHRPFTPAQVQRGRFRDYLKAVLRNSVITHFRRDARRPMTDSAPDIAEDSDDGADRAWVTEWRACLLRRAWQALELHEIAAPEGIAYTVLRLTADFPEESSPELARRAATRSGRDVSVDTFRKQLSRARRHFAQMLLDEVRETLENGGADEVVEELCDLGLLEFVRDFLPEHFKTVADR